MRKDIIRSAIVIVAATVVLGFDLPGRDGRCSVRWSSRSQANGSLIPVHGKTVGSKLAAQAFNGPRYFHERPSAVAYNADGTSFSNLGPNSKALAALVKTRIAEDHGARGPVQPRALTVSDIPVDAVTASGSGIDPDISKAYADLQARADRGRSAPSARDRPAADRRPRRRPLARASSGEPGVNVLELNLALDQEH